METPIILPIPDDLNLTDTQPTTPTATEEVKPERSKTHKRAGITKNHSRKRSKTRRLMERSSRHANRGH